MDGPLPHPRVESLTDGATVCLIEDLRANIVTGPAAWTVVVPTGFQTDGASIPRWAWTIVGPPLASAYFPAAIVHDYLCHLAYGEKSYSMRVIADAVFLALMGRQRVAWWRRSVMYLAVRWYGRYRYLRV